MKSSFRWEIRPKQNNLEVIIPNFERSDKKHDGCGYFFWSIEDKGLCSLLSNTFVYHTSLWRKTRTSRKDALLRLSCSQHVEGNMGRSLQSLDYPSENYTCNPWILRFQLRRDHLQTLRCDENRTVIFVRVDRRVQPLYPLIDWWTQIHAWSRKGCRKKCAVCAHRNSDPLSDDFFRTELQENVIH